MNKKKIIPLILNQNYFKVRDIKSTNNVDFVSRMLNCILYFCLKAFDLKLILILWCSLIWTFKKWKKGDGKNGKKGPKYLVAENTFGIKTINLKLTQIYCLP